MIICIGGGRHGALYSPSKVEHTILNSIYADGIQDKFYLPGDIKKCMPGYYAYKFNLDMKKVRDLLQNMNYNMQPLLDEIINQLRDVSGSVFEAVKEIEKKYPRDPNLSIRPIKAIKAAGLNRKVIPVIYHHIRSNC